MFTINEATRTNSPLSIYLEGESGSGKTYSALLLARGLVGQEGKMGIIDTEGGRSLIYADDPDIGGFKHLPFEAPYSPERCIEAFKAAKADGWGCIVFDSASLEHDGEGGLLEMAETEYERLLQKNPNSRAADMQKWTKPKLAHKRFLNFAVGLPIHVIFCVRQTLTTDMKTKSTILSPVIEKNTKFSLEIHGNVSTDHKTHWSRVPKPYLPAIEQDSIITASTGAKLAASNGGSAHHEPPANPISGIDRDQCVFEVKEMARSYSVNREQIQKALQKMLNRKTPVVIEELTDKQLDRLSTEDGFKKVAAVAVNFQ